MPKDAEEYKVFFLVNRSLILPPSCSMGGFTKPIGSQKDSSKVFIQYHV